MCRWYHAWLSTYITVSKDLGSWPSWAPIGANLPEWWKNHRYLSVSFPLYHPSPLNFFFLIFICLFIWDREKFSWVGETEIERNRFLQTCFTFDAFTLQVETRGSNWDLCALQCVGLTRCTTSWPPSEFLSLANKDKKNLSKKEWQKNIKRNYKIIQFFAKLK